MAGNCSYLVISAQVINMARTKQTAEKGMSGAPMQQEGQQWQEQRLGIEEVKNQGQKPRSPGDTGWVLLYCERSGSTREQQSC